MAGAADSVELDVDSIIEKLLEVRGQRPGKQVQLAEEEIRALCVKSREVFLQQPILLELQVCSTLAGIGLLLRTTNSGLCRHPSKYAATFTGSTSICCDCLNMAASPPSLTTCSWATMSTEVWLCNGRLMYFRPLHASILMGRSPLPR